MKDFNDFIATNTIHYKQSPIGTQKARQVYNKSSFKYWSHLSDLNGRPTDYKSVALPAELKWHY